MSEVGNIIRGEFGGQAAQAKFITSELEPEKAQRAVELSDAMGVGSLPISEDLDAFDKYHKQSLGAQIIKNNPAIQGYLDSHPMAASVSKNDLANLDEITQGVKSFREMDTPLKTMVELFKEGYGDGPLIGKWLMDQEPGAPGSAWNEDGSLKYPVLSAIAVGMGAYLEVPARMFGGGMNLAEAGLAGAYTKLTGDEAGGKQLARDFAGLVENYMPMHMGRTPRIREHNKGLEKGVKDVYNERIVEMYLRSGADLPIGVSKEIDGAIERVAKDYWKNIDDLASQADKSETKELNPAFFKTFLEQHPGLRDVDIRVDPEAIKKLYGDNTPQPGDGLFGFIPNLGSILEVGADLGMPVRVSVIDWVTHVPKEVRDAVKDDSRPKLGSLSKTEAEELKVWNQLDVFKEEEPKEPTLVRTEDGYNIVDDTGKVLSEVQIDFRDPKRPFIKYFGDLSRDTEEGFGMFGPAKLRGLLRQFAKLHPEAEEIGGLHTSEESLKANRGVQDMWVKLPKELSQDEEALRSVRQSSGLEPTEGIFDNIKEERKYGAEKLKLARLDAKAREDLDINMGSKDAFDITDEKGNIVGTLQGVYYKPDKEFYIDWISSRAWAQSFGPKQVLQLVKELKAEYPDVETITGRRVTGARTGTAKEGEKVTFKAQVNPEAPSGWDIIEGEPQEGKWHTFAQDREGNRLEGLVKPKKLWTENEQKIRDVVNRVIDKIGPEGQKRGTVHGLRSSEGNTQSGVFISFDQTEALVLVSLTSRDPIATAAHEAGHALKKSRAFSDAEWDILTERALKGDGDKGTWFDQYDIKRRYGDRSKSEQIEEAIMHKFGDYVSGKWMPEAGPIRELFERLKEIVTQIRLGLKEIFGRELSAEDIFEKARIGGYKGRRPLTSRAEYVFRPEDIKAQRQDEIDNLVSTITKKIQENPTLAKIGAEPTSAASNPFVKKGLANIQRRSDARINDIMERLPENPTSNDILKAVTGDVDIKFQREEQLELPGVTRVEDREVFEKASVAGLTVKQYKQLQKAIDAVREQDEKYQLEKAEKYEKRRLTKEWKDESQAMEPEVRETLQRMPEFQVADFFHEGKLDGEKYKKPKLDPKFIPEELLEGVPEEFLDSKKGMPPDDVAGLLGMTGKELLEHLANWEDARRTTDKSHTAFTNQLVRGEIERRMSEKHGPLSENIIDAARDHVINNAQYELIHQEVLAAAVRAGSELPISKKDMELAVKERFENAPVGNVSYPETLREMGKAQRAATMALLDGDPAAAFKHEQDRMMYFLAAREAKKVDKIKDKFWDNAKRYGKREVKGIEQNYLNFIHDIYMKLGEVKLDFIKEDWDKRVSEGSHANLEDFVMDKMNDLLEIKYDDRFFDDALRTDPAKPAIDDLTVKQFVNAHDFIQSMIKNGREEARGDRALDNSLFEIAKQAMRNELATFDPLEFMDAKGNRKMLKIIPSGAAHLIRTAVAAHWQMEAIFNRIDRGDPFGIFTQKIIRPLVEASNNASTIERRYSAKLDAIEYKGNMNEKIPNSIFKEPSALAEPDRTAWMAMTRENLLKILMYWGSETGREKLSRGYNIHPDSIQRWIDSNATKADYEYAEAMGKVFRDLKDEIDIMYTNVAGVSPEDIKLSRVVTPYGQQFDGWYTPLVPHPNAEMTKFGGAGFSGLVQRGFFRSTTANGHVMRRTSAVYPLDLSIDSNISVMKRQIYDLAMRPGLIEASRFLRDPDIRSMITSRFGREITDLINPYLKDVANVMDHNDSGWAQAKQALTIIRSNVIGTLIGWNPGTVMKHGPTALVQSVTEVGPKRFSEASAKLWMVNEDVGKMNWDFAMETSEELQRRHQHYFETLRGQSASMLGKGTKREFMARVGAYPVAMSDLASAVPLWIARFEQAVKEEGHTQGDAVYLADRAVRRAHGSTAVTNRPRVMRSEAMAFFNPLYGFFNHILNRKYEMAWQTKDKVQDYVRGKITPTEFLKFAPHLAAMISAYVLAPTLVEETVSPLPQKKDDSWGKNAGKALLYTQGSDWLIARDVAHFAVGGFDPSIGLFGPMSQATRDFVHDISDIDKATSEEHMGATLRHTITATGMATGLTNAQMGRWAELAYNHSTGKDMPDGWWQWLAALRFGKTKGHSKSFDEYIEHMTGAH